MKTYHSKQIDRNVTVPDYLVTKNVGGYDFELERGVRYIASRPLAERGRKVYPVTVRQFRDTPNWWYADAEVVIDGLDYDAANALLAAFNNGPTSFTGRVW